MMLDAVFDQKSRIILNVFEKLFFFLSNFYRPEETKSKSMSLESSSKSDKKHKKKHKKEKHKKSKSHKKEKRKKHNRSNSDSDENIRNKNYTPPPPQKITNEQPQLTTINLDDDDNDKMRKSKDLLSKLIGKRDNNHENGNGSAAVKRPPLEVEQSRGVGESKSKKPKLIPTDPDELVNIIKKTIEVDIIPTVVSSASDSEG
jgi:hypothetical protein